MDVKDKTEGVVIGILMGFDGPDPLVVYSGNPSDKACTARALCALSAEDTGREMALLFEDGDRSRPLIIGRIVKPARQEPAKMPPGVVRDGETVKITAEDRIELRVGKSVIIMEKDGHITIRGKNLVSHASASNRIRGSSVNLN